jgi:hypothetical protein
MKTVVYSGETYTLRGTLAAGDGLLALTGGVIRVRGHATSDGTIGLAGAMAGGAAGAALLVSGTLTNDGLISVAGGYDGAGGTIDDTGLLTNAGRIVVGAGANSYGALLNIDLGATLDNTGRLSVDANFASGQTGLAAPGGRLVDNGMLVNGGILVVDGGVGENSGDFPAAAAIVSGTLQNLGQITLRGGDGNGYGTYLGYGGGGTLDVTGLLNNGGTIGVDHTPAVFRGSPGRAGVLIDAGRVMNSGLIQLETGNFASYLYGQALGGTMVVLGQLTNSGVVDVQGGQGGQYYSDVSFGALLLDQGQMANTGTIDIGGRSAVPPSSFYDGSGGTLADVGVLTNQGLIVVGAGTSAGDALLSVSSTLDNDGSLVVAGGSTRYGDTGGTLSVSGTLVNAGTLVLSGGTGNALTPGIDNGAQALLGAGSSVGNLYGLIVVGGGAAYGYGGGATGPASGATLSIWGYFSNNGTIDVQPGGTAYRDDPGGGGVLVDSGSLFNFGAIAIDGGRAPGYAASGYGASATVAAGGELINDGTVTVGAGQSTYGAGGTGGVLDVVGQLDNEGTLLVGGQMAGSYANGSAGLVTVSGTLINDALIVLQGGTGAGGAGGITVTATGTLINDGTIEGRGTVTTVGALSGHGVFELQAGSVVAFGGSVGAGETISFLAGASALRLGDAAQFSGVLQGVQAGVAIDVGGLAVTEASVAGNALDLTLGSGGTLDLHLAAPLAAGISVHLSSDGAGGTEVSFLGQQ